MRELPVHGTAAIRRNAGGLGDVAKQLNERSIAAGPIHHPPIHHAAFRLGTIEPPSVILLKELLGPGVTVAMLAACMWAHGARLSIESLALGVIVFLLSQKVLSTPESQTSPGGQREQRPTLSRLLLEWACISALLIFIVLALRLTRLVGPGALTAWFFATPIALLISNAATIKLSRWWTARRPASARHIIIGATEAGLELARRLQQSSYSGHFLGFFDFRDRSRLPPASADQWLGGCTQVADFVRREGVDAIYVALPISNAPRIAELLRQLRDTTASIYLVPANIFEFELVQPRCIEVRGIPALAICETPHQGWSAFTKRSVDVMLALLALLLAGPAMLAIAVAVRISSGGPVLFKQRRYGLNGEEIFIYKFRSMTVCEDGPLVPQARRNDCRTTKLGRLLRRSSLDELPQILNVLQGKMSFVGPRPHAIAHNEMYRKLISGYMTRHKVRPGITGWAQVNGLRGQTDTLEKMRQRIEYDLDYLNNWSLWLDLKILLRTLVLVLRDEHAY